MDVMKAHFFVSYTPNRISTPTPSSISLPLRHHPLDLHFPIFQARIQTLIDRHRPHTIPAALAVRKYKRVLLGEPHFALDGAQVEAPAAVGASTGSRGRGRSAGCDAGCGGIGSACGEAYPSGVLWKSVRVAETVWGSRELIGSGARECRRLGQAQMALSVAGYVEGSCAVRLFPVLAYASVR